MWPQAHMSSRNGRLVFFLKRAKALLEEIKTYADQDLPSWDVTPSHTFFFSRVPEAPKKFLYWNRVAEGDCLSGD